MHLCLHLQWVKWLPEFRRMLLEFQCRYDNLPADLCVMYIDLLLFCFYLLIGWLVLARYPLCEFFMPCNFLSCACKPKLTVILSSVLLQRLLVPRKCRRPDAACTLSAWRPARPRNPTSRPSDSQPESWRGGVRCHHQHLDAACLHWRKGLCQSVGHQSARKQEPYGPAGLFGETWGWSHQICTHLLKIEI